MPATCSRPAAWSCPARAPSSEPTTPSAAATSGTDWMAGAASSAIAGLRGRGALDAGTATVWLVLAAAPILLLIGCLRSTTFAGYTVQGLARGSVYGSL